MFPTPKYNKIVNKTREIEVINPRLELAKIRDEVKSIARKRTKKKREIAPNVSGSIK